MQIPPNPTIYPRLLDDPVLFPELLLDTTEMALAMASTADSRSAKVFLSERSASVTQQRVTTGKTNSYTLVIIIIYLLI